MQVVAGTKKLLKTPFLPPGYDKLIRSPCVFREDLFRVLMEKMPEAFVYCPDVWLDMYTTTNRKLCPREYLIKIMCGLLPEKMEQLILKLKETLSISAH